MFDWEAQLLQKAVLDEEAVDFQEDGVRLGGPAAPEAFWMQLGETVFESQAVGFKKTLFDWEAQLLLVQAVLEQEGWLSRRRCSTGRPSCSSYAGRGGGGFQDPARCSTGRSSCLLESHRRIACWTLDIPAGLFKKTRPAPTEDSAQSNAENKV